MMRVISLFSGCGGGDLGLKQAGFVIVYANDKAKSVASTYRANLGDIEIADIRDIDKARLPDAEIILAGIPCQPFSNAGKRKGLKDDRGTLFEQVAEVAVAKRPLVVVMENVKGILSKTKDAISGAEAIQAAMKDIGYNVYTKLLRAEDYEVPQRRHRVFFVCIRSNVDNGKFEFPTPIPQSALTIEDILTLPLPDEEPLVKKLSPASLYMVSLVPEGGCWKDIDYELLPTRLKKIRDTLTNSGCPTFYRRHSLSSIVGTITATSSPEFSSIIHPKENRRYSVREIARFQSFPDSFQFTGASINQKYAMIGNAIPPKLMYHLALSIKSFLQDLLSPTKETM